MEASVTDGVTRRVWKERQERGVPSLTALAVILAWSFLLCASYYPFDIEWRLAVVE